MGRRREGAARLRGGFESAAAVGADGPWKGAGGERGPAAPGRGRSGGRGATLRGRGECARVARRAGRAVSRRRGRVLGCGACGPRRSAPLPDALPAAQPDLPLPLQELRGSDTELPRAGPAGAVGQVGAPSPGSGAGARRGRNGLRCVAGTRSGWKDVFPFKKNKPACPVSWSSL